MSITYINPSLRRAVIERSGNCCEYCRISQTDQFFSFEIDHIIAEKHGGQTQTENLCLSCPDYNAFKGSDIASIDWETDQAVTSLFNPRQHLWNDHFIFDTHTGEIKGNSAIGRVTVTLLRLNDPDRVVDRKLLFDTGRYLPNAAN